MFLREQASNLRKATFTMSLEEAKKELERIMESGNKAELRKFVKRSYEDTDKAIAILDVLIPDATERKAGD